MVTSFQHVLECLKGLWGGRGGLRVVFKGLRKVLWETGGREEGFVENEGFDGSAGLEEGLERGVWGWGLGESGGRWGWRRGGRRGELEGVGESARLSPSIPPRWGPPSNHTCVLKVGAYASRCEWSLLRHACAQLGKVCALCSHHRLLTAGNHPRPNHPRH